MRRYAARSTLLDAVPGVWRVGIFYNPDDPHEGRCLRRTVAAHRGTNRAARRVTGQVSANPGAIAGAARIGEDAGSRATTLSTYLYDGPPTNPAPLGQIQRPDHPGEPNRRPAVAECPMDGFVAEAATSGGRCLCESDRAQQRSDGHVARSRWAFAAIGSAVVAAVIGGSRGVAADREAGRHRRAVRTRIRPNSIRKIKVNRESPLPQISAAKDPSSRPGWPHCQDFLQMVICY
jgi:hypothetical protein